MLGNATPGAAVLRPYGLVSCQFVEEEIHEVAVIGEYVRFGCRA